MSLHDLVIDLVGTNPTDDTTILYLIATEPWPAGGQAAPLLQAKLKAYVAFAADGQLARQYPDARDKDVRIVIRSDYPLGEVETRLVSAARQSWCEPEGISLVVSIKGAAT